jgi:tRNA synthetases class I (M)
VNQRRKTKNNMSDVENLARDLLGANLEDAHDRWSLKDEATIDYGHCAKTGGVGNPDKSFYITTAINYANGPAHMGHAYEGVTSDVIARFARLCGDQSVYFLTGSDEHGQKIASTAEKEGVTPIDLCDKVCYVIALNISLVCVVFDGAETYYFFVFRSVFGFLVCAWIPEFESEGSCQQ